MQKYYFLEASNKLNYQKIQIINNKTSKQNHLIIRIIIRLQIKIFQLSNKIILKFLLFRIQSCRWPQSHSLLISKRRKVKIKKINSK